jgi:plastocyanin
MRQLLLSFTLALVVLGSTLLVGCGSATSSGSQTAYAAPRVASVTIPQGQEVFSPFILTVQPNTIVTWQNNDTMPHTIMTTWDQSNFLNPQAFALNVAASQKVSFTFTKPGLYDYFDNSQATWDKTDDRVSAKKHGPNFPLSMEGIIWVQGHISGLPSSATNAIPKGKDDFITDFLAITQGGTVSWHNGDTDKHFIDQVYGWSGSINPVDLGNNLVKGTDDAPPNGGTTTVHFNMPGLYYYYCSAHADVNLQWHRVAAHKDASEAPIPMEGFVLVMGR